MKKKILLFYISKYSGHFQAARAVENAILELDQACETTLVNAFDYANPILGRLITRAYLEVIKKKPHIWGNLYDNPDVLKKTVKAREVLHRYNKPKMRKLLDSFQPDVIYCTQAFPCGMVADYKKTFKKTIPLIAVLTDHAPHSYWIFEEVDIYVAPSESTARVLEKKGVPAGKIRVYGIPVDTGFRKDHDRPRLREKYGVFHSLPTVLLMGGSQGLGDMEKVVRYFLRDEGPRYQLLVVTGTNRKLYSRLTKMVSSEEGFVKVFPYIDKIEELMELSDIIITKAGGITTAEALAKGLPILIINPIPGQERMNTEYLVREGAAIEVIDYTKVYDVVDGLFVEKNGLLKMKENAERVAMPESALRIAELAMKEV